MKKLFALMLALITVFAVAACGNGGDDGDLEHLEEARDRLVLSVERDNIKSDIDLPSELGNYPDVDISWESDNTDIIANDGTVTRPEPGEGNANVTLTATLSYEGEEVTRDYALTVIEGVEEVLFEDFSVLYDRDSEEAPSMDDVITVQGLVSAKWNGGVFLYDGETHFGIYDAWDFDIHEDVEHGDEVKYVGPYARYNTLFQIGERESYEVLSEDNEIDVPVEDSSIEDIHDYEADGEDMDVHGRHFKVSGKITHKSDGENESFYIESIESDEQLRVYHYSIDDNSGDAYGDVDDETTTALGAYIDEVVELEVVYYTDHSTDGILVVFEGGEDDIESVELSDEEQLEVDVNSLQDQVTAGDDISLPGTVDSGTEFTNWESSDTSLIDDDGSFVDYPDSEETVTFTGDASLNDETQNDVTFEVTVAPEEGTDSASDVYDAEEGDTVYTEGVVYSVYNGGYFIYDGENSLSISTGDDVDDAEVEEGDNVLVYGSRAEDYHTLPQISSVQAEHVKSEGNATGIDSEAA
ncbi:MAG: immunoglobulin-like domain-containing protein, partial [Bacillota bacterium]